MNGVDLKISSAAAGQVVVNGTLMVNGVDIMALVAAQAVEIEALKNGPVLCGSMTITSDTVPALPGPAASLAAA